MNSWARMAQIQFYFLNLIFPRTNFFITRTNLFLTPTNLFVEISKLLKTYPMSHSLNKVWIHAIWATKKRAPLITSSIESKLFTFIKNEFKELGCSILIINGWTDHVHCLFLLNPKKSMAEVIKQIKGSSSCFINKENLSSEKFSWQVGYAAFSVSESVKNKVFEYIKNQKAHHQKKAFEQELNDFLELHKIENG